MSISADLQGLKIPQLQGAAAIRLASQRSSFPALTLRITSRISLGETMPWPHMVVNWRMSAGGRRSVLPWIPRERLMVWGFSPSSAADLPDPVDDPADHDRDPLVHLLDFGQGVFDLFPVFQYAEDLGSIFDAVQDFLLGNPRDTCSAGGWSRAGWPAPGGRASLPGVCTLGPLPS